MRGGRESTGRDAVEMGAARRRLRRRRNSAHFHRSRRHASGFDIPLTAAISRAVSVPVIASGGAKLPEHFAQIFSEGAADAALAASIFHDSVQSIRELKHFLAARNIEVRLPC